MTALKRVVTRQYGSYQGGVYRVAYTHRVLVTSGFMPDQARKPGVASISVFGRQATIAVSVVPGKADITVLGRATTAEDPGKIPVGKASISVAGKRPSVQFILQDDSGVLRHRTRVFSFGSGVYRRQYYKVNYDLLIFPKINAKDVVAGKATITIFGKQPLVIPIPVGKGDLTIYGKQPLVSKDGEFTVTPGKADLTVYGRKTIAFDAALIKSLLRESNLRRAFQARYTEKHPLPPFDVVLHAIVLPLPYRIVQTGRSRITIYGRATSRASITIPASKGEVLVYGRQPDLPPQAGRGIITVSGRATDAIRVGPTYPGKGDITVLVRIPLVFNQDIETSTVAGKGSLTVQGRSASKQVTIPVGKADISLIGNLTTGDALITPGRGLITVFGRGPINFASPGKAEITIFGRLTKSFNVTVTTDPDKGSVTIDGNSPVVISTGYWQKVASDETSWTQVATTTTTWSAGARATTTWTKI